MYVHLFTGSLKNVPKFMRGFLELSFDLLCVKYIDNVADIETEVFIFLLCKLCYMLAL